MSGFLGLLGSKTSSPKKDEKISVETLLKRAEQSRSQGHNFNATAHVTKVTEEKKQQKRRSSILGSLSPFAKPKDPTPKDPKPSLSEESKSTTESAKPAFKMNKQREKEVDKMIDKLSASILSKANQDKEQRNEGGTRKQPVVRAIEELDIFVGECTVQTPEGWSPNAEPEGMIAELSVTVLGQTRKIVLENTFSIRQRQLRLVFSQTFHIKMEVKAGSNVTSGGIVFELNVRASKKTPLKVYGTSILDSRGHAKKRRVYLLKNGGKMNVSEGSLTYVIHYHDRLSDERAVVRGLRSLSQADREFLFLRSRRLNWPNNKAASFDKVLESYLDRDPAVEEKIFAQQVRRTMQAHERQRQQERKGTGCKRIMGSRPKQRQTHCGVGYVGLSWSDPGGKGSAASRPLSRAARTLEQKVTMRQAKAEKRRQDRALEYQHKLTLEGRVLQARTALACQKKKFLQDAMQIRVRMETETLRKRERLACKKRAEMVREREALVAKRNLAAKIKGELAAKRKHVQAEKKRQRLLTNMEAQEARHIMSSINKILEVE